MEGGAIDPRRAYLQTLPSGDSIAIFFYDGPIAKDIAFDSILTNGEQFAQRLTGAFDDRDEPQLVHVATDGETYGHHQHHGDMALSYCLHHIEAGGEAELTVYGQYLEAHPPEYEVEIVEETSWSCMHGIERWRADCGCTTGGHEDWHQRWRAPLRNALDWLRDMLAPLYEKALIPFVDDPWTLRDRYIEVILDRDERTLAQFFERYTTTKMTDDTTQTLLELLEMQRHAMLMYTSCGWFFEELSGIETVQVIQYASRAIQLAEKVTGADLEPVFVSMLEQAPSNLERFETGAGIYEEFVSPAKIDLFRVGAHYAVSSLFREYDATARIYCYRIETRSHETLRAGRQRLAIGRTKVRSQITHEATAISYAVLHMGDHNLVGAVRYHESEAAFDEMHEAIVDTFKRSDIPAVIRLLDTHFKTHNYSLWHLFRDEQREILAEIIDPSLNEIEALFAQLYDQHYPLMHVMTNMDIPLPHQLESTATLVVNTRLQQQLGSDRPDIHALEQLMETATALHLDLDTQTLGYLAGKRAAAQLETVRERFESGVEVKNNIDLVLEDTIRLFECLRSLPLEVPLWRAQNIYFELREQLIAQARKQAAEDEARDESEGEKGEESGGGTEDETEAAMEPPGGGLDRLLDEEQCASIKRLAQLLGVKLA